MKCYDKIETVHVMFLNFNFIIHILPHIITIIYILSNLVHSMVPSWLTEKEIVLSGSKVTSQVVLVVKNPPANAGNMRRVGSLGREDLLEKEMATHSSILGWRILWAEELGRLHTVHGVTKSQTGLK